jgi:thiol-disulfide isomerase/thioredoxin
MNSLIAIALLVLVSAPLQILADQAKLPKGILALDGRPAPPLQLEDMDGNAYSLAEARGHWVFVHFWASWCGPCRREMPTIQQMVSRLDASALKVMLINTAEDEDTVFSFMGIVAPELATLLDRDGLTTEQWQPRGLPATYLVDPQGRLRYQALGGRPWDRPEYIGFLKRVTTEQNAR